MNPSYRELVERLREGEPDEVDLDAIAAIERLSNKASALEDDFTRLGLKCAGFEDKCERLSKDNDRLRECVRDLDGLVEHAQQILSNHLPPDGISKDDAINMLLELLDGPDQREIQSRAHSALNTTAETEGSA